MEVFFLAVAGGCVLASVVAAWATIKGLKTEPKWEPGTLKESWL